MVGERVTGLRNEEREAFEEEEEMEEKEEERMGRGGGVMRSDEGKTDSKTGGDHQSLYPVLSPFPPRTSCFSFLMFSDKSPWYMRRGLAARSEGMQRSEDPAVDPPRLSPARAAGHGRSSPLFCHE